MSLLFTDASSIIKSIEEIHAQHVDLTPDNPHVLRYTRLTIKESQVKEEFLKKWQ